MVNFTIVTGNQHKIAELQRLIPAHISFDHVDIDLDEIQTLDQKALVVDKAKRAYEILQKPVVVEDVGAGLVALNGLPGPFIKFFEQKLGLNSLCILAKDDTRTIVTYAVCYYDGVDAIVAQVQISGRVEAYDGDGSFGFDHIFIPDGHAKTYGEMTPEEKDSVSHRAQGIKQLLTHSKFNNI